ncbi:MAG: hypothetical protein II625_08780 [Bacilli bacterium]|nr:hypothetical protein [Bacilli bacterium]
MAKNIKGITIEIGGDTTKLESALKDVNKTVYSTNSELRNLNQALKLDPKNTELLAQKQDVLKKNIAATTERLNTLKEAQRQMGDYNSLTEEQKEQYRALSVEIAKGEAALKQLNEEGSRQPKDNTKDWKEKLKDLGETAKKVAAELGKVTLAVGGALTGLVTAGVKSYADLEQNLGGVETLFGKSADKVVENAKKAYKTAGVSANEYMAGVTSFSASLLQSLGGDTAKAADVADMAFRDMSDNANKFGTDMSSIQNAYQGFAKQNYTMLDNLKLGYGGTKTEMERLLKDAEKFSGVKYDINNLNDVYEAIHVIQEEMGVTGTTAQEAEKTISGSVASMKAAFDNFLNGSGSPEALAESLTNVFSNIGGAILQLAPSILSGVVTLIQTLVPQISQLLLTMIPQLLTAITNMINTLLSMVTSNLSGISKALSTIINSVVTFITSNLPTIIQLGLQLIVALAQGIAQSLPQLIPSIVECITTIVDVILDNLPQIIMVALDLIVALALGIVKALPKLADKIPQIITKIVEVLTKPEMIVKLVGAALKIMVALAEGLIKAMPQIISAVPKIITAIVKGFSNNIKNTNWAELGKNIIKGICDGFGKIGSYISRKVNEVKDQVVSKFKSIFGIHSPSTLMRDTIGLNITAGIGEGIEEGIPKALKDVDFAMKQLNAGIEASVNPTINPSVTYETSYNMMAKAMKEALSDMDVVMDDNKMGRFVVKTVTDTIYS